MFRRLTQTKMSLKAAFDLSEERMFFVLTILTKDRSKQIFWNGVSDLDIFERELNDSQTRILSLLMAHFQLTKEEVINETEKSVRTWLLTI